jgi:hypothetical protein
MQGPQQCGFCFWPLPYEQSFAVVADRRIAMPCYLFVKKNQPVVFQQRAVLSYFLLTLWICSTISAGSRFVFSNIRQPRLLVF